MKLLKAISQVITNKIISEQLAPLSDNIECWLVTSLTKNEFVGMGDNIFAVDIGPYYTLVPYGGMEKLPLFDKDLFKKQGKANPPLSYDEINFIKETYTNGEVEYASRGNILSKKIVARYRKLIESVLDDSDFVMHRNLITGNRAYSFIKDDLAIFRFYNDVDSLFCYNDFRDYFNVDYSDMQFHDTIIDIFNERGIPVKKLKYAPRNNGSLEYNFKFEKQIPTKDGLKMLKAMFGK